jgi:hypothetical protein
LVGFDLTTEPRRRFRGRHQVCRRLQHLRLEPLAPIALEVRPVTGRNAFEFGEFGFRRLDAGLERGDDFRINAAEP